MMKKLKFFLLVSGTWEKCSLPSLLFGIILRIKKGFKFLYVVKLWLYTENMIIIFEGPKDSTKNE